MKKNLKFLSIFNTIFNLQLFILILNFLSGAESKHIIIPLTKYNYDFNEKENILSKIYSNIYYTKLSIGEPYQSIATFINTTSISNIGIINKFCDKKFYINNSQINKDYIYKNSSSFHNYKNENMILGTKDILISEQIKFYTNFELNKEINVDNISLLYNPNNEGYIIDDVGIDFILEREKKTTCGYIGFQLGFQRNNIYNNLLEQLKEKKIISKTVFSFIDINKRNELYKKNNVDCLLVLGEELYDIININNVNVYISDKYSQNKIQEKNKLNDYVINEGYYYFVWEISCSSIYITLNNNKNNLLYLEQIDNVYLDQDFGLIAGNGEYRDLIEKFFFNEYITKSKCFKNLLKNEIFEYNFFYYECDSDIELDKFPNLFFKSKILQYEYSLGKDDLFIKDKDKLYFLIIFELRNSNSWKLGKPFLDKYLFSYNYEARTISFYNENLLMKEESISNNDNNYKSIIIIILIIILSLTALILGFLYGKNIYNLRKKKKAYELDIDSDNSLIKEDKWENKENKGDFSINL